MKTLSKLLILAACFHSLTSFADAEVTWRSAEFQGKGTNPARCAENIIFQALQKEISFEAKFSARPKWRYHHGEQAWIRFSQTTPYYYDLLPMDEWVNSTNDGADHFDRLAFDLKIETFKLKENLKVNIDLEYRAVKPGLYTCKGQFVTSTEWLWDYRPKGITFWERF